MGTAEPLARRYLQLVGAIERHFRVAEWHAGDVDLWPLASQDLFLELFREAGGNTSAAPPPFIRRAASSLASPAVNFWKSRDDLAHWLPRPRKADVLLLGDGVSLDFVDGAWRDRHAEPIAAALEGKGRSSFLMQAGNLSKLPWARPTFAANQVAAAGAVIAGITKKHSPHLPDHAGVMRLLAEAGVHAASLSTELLSNRARTVAAQAVVFEHILRRVQPRLAFVVTYYAGLGPAFALACRRRGVLCVDLQHCSHDAAHRAYSWSTIPVRGYSTVPGLFWTWTAEDAASIQRWADGQWHDAVPGGHPQIAALRGSESERLWHEALAGIGDATQYDREILVALQPIGGRRHVWEALAHQILSSPRSWRWWIRRHPASSKAQDEDYAPLLALDSSRAVVGEASQIPLPALLGHMDALVSLASGAAGEAAMFGVPAFFLDEEALHTFPRLIEQHAARLVAVETLHEAIAQSSRRWPSCLIEPPLTERGLLELEARAEDYARLCRAK